MKDLLRNSVYYGKMTYRDLGFTFWSLAYPIILAVFYYLAFSGISNIQMETINVGINQENPILYVLENIEILNVVEISKGEIDESIKSGKIDGYIKDDLSLLVNESGLNQTIIKSVLDQTKQTIALNEPMENFDFGIDYLRGKTQSSSSILVVFYAMIAMVSTYGVFSGINTATIMQANLSSVGARISVTPIKKSMLLLSCLMVGLLMNISSNILLMLFLKFVLKMDLFINLLYSSIFIFVGNIFGISLGVFIGASNKKSVGFKTMISIVATLFLSFLSGMMSPEIKVMLDITVPILGKINPISIVSNSLYRINMLGITKNLNQGIILLISYSFLFMGISFLILRRSQYDSI